MDGATLIPLVCVNCGGSLEATVSADLFRCPYCKQLMLLRRVDAASPTRSATRLVAQLEWPANAQRPDAPLNWQGGTLYLVDDALAFVPHAFNFGPLERATVPFELIASADLTTGFISDDVTVRLRDGSTWGFRVRKGDALCDALRSRGVVV